MEFRDGSLYRWVVAPTSSVIIDSKSIEENPLGSHSSMAKRHKLTGRVFGGFLRVHGDDIIFAGGSQTVTPGTPEILSRAVEERGITIDR